MGLIGPNGPMMGPPPGIMGGMPPMGGDNMMRMAPPPAFKQGLPPMGPLPMGGGMMPQGNKMDNKVKINNLLRDKERLLQMDPNAAKRALMETLKILAEEEGADSNPRLLSNFSFYLDLLATNKSVEELYRYLEKTESIKQSIERIKQSEN